MCDYATVGIGIVLGVMTIVIVEDDFEEPVLASVRAMRSHRFRPWSLGFEFLKKGRVIAIANAFEITLGGAGLILFWGADQPIAALPVEHYRLTVNPALPSLPLFTLAGYFMAEGGASRRLVRVFQAQQQKRRSVPT